MKPANLNEMDVMLRSLARRDSGVVSAHVDAESHLDADELNAFAEGVVTEPARARYSAHLADCTNCRRIVVGLTQSVGFTAHRVATEDEQAASFWQQLAGFFSNPVLRFAIPAVLLVSIIGIGVIALRQEGPGEFIAQHDPSRQPPNVDQANQTVPGPSSTPTEPTAAFATPTTPIARDSHPEAGRGEGAGSVAGVPPSEGPATLQKEADAQPSQSLPTFAPDVTAPAPPPPREKSAERGQEQFAARQEPRKREDEALRVNESQPQDSDSLADRNKAATATRRAANQPQPGKVQGLMRDGRAYENKDKNKSDTSDDAETRTVSGKRFVRQNNAWIDSAYRQSSTTTNVKRGSEQYRALIADEPGLRTFSEQLGGEVVVVWKGRAYKFH